MGLITEIDYTKLEPIAKKHGITSRQALDIWNDVHNISEQVKTENAPLEYLNRVHQDMTEFLQGFNRLREANSKTDDKL